MRTVLNPAHIPGVTSPFLAPDDALFYRLRLVLETRPGQIPWRPDFGCDLGPLVGQPSTPQRLAELRWRVESAIRRWLPDLELVACRVRITALGVRLGPSPSPESGLLGLGTQVGLQVDVAVREQGEVRAITLPDPIAQPWRR